MESHREIGKDGQQLLWREHAFSDLLRAKGSPELLLEPLLNPMGEDAEVKFRFDAEQEIAWRWQDWSRAEIIFCKVSGEEVREPRRSPAKPLVELNRLGDTAEIEVHLHDDHGATQAVRCRVAAVLPSSDISFKQLDDLLMIKAGAGLHTQNIQVVKLQDRQEGPRAWGAQVSFGGKNEVATSLRDFARGAVAVFLQNGTHRRLLALRYIGGGELHPGAPNRTEWVKIEQCLNRGNGSRSSSTVLPSWENWLNNWTELSQRRLNLLRETAVRLSGLDSAALGQTLQENPTGFSRCLIFRQLDCEWAGQSTYIPLLEEGELLTATGRVFPGLNSILQRPLSLEEKLWAIQRGQNLQVAEAMTEAAGRGLPSLRRALHLAEKRAEAIKARNLRHRTVGR